MAAEESKEGRIVDPSSTGTVRELTGRVISRRQVLGLAGGALAGVAALGSMPKTAGAVVDSSNDVPTPLTYHGQGTFGRLFPRLPAFTQDSPEVRSRLLELGKRGGIMDAATRRLRRTR
jgi:hypothetical protein